MSMDFKNLPDRSTPINAENLNKLNNIRIGMNEPTMGEDVWIDTNEKKIKTKVATSSGNEYHDFSDIVKISNSNGTAIKFSDGTMICYINKVDNNIAIDNVYGSLFISKAYAWNFPVEFIDIPTLCCTKFQWGTSASWGSVLSTGKNVGYLRGYDAYTHSSGTDTEIGAFAIGRWK